MRGRKREAAGLKRTETITTATTIQRYQRKRTTKYDGRKTASHQNARGTRNYLVLAKCERMIRSTNRTGPGSALHRAAITAPHRTALALHYGSLRVECLLRLRSLKSASLRFETR